MVGTITWKTRGKAKERPKDMQPMGSNKGRELVRVVVGGYLTQSPSNVTLMSPLCKS
jgi:hypothetical protein